MSFSIGGVVLKGKYGPVTWEGLTSGKGVVLDDSVNWRELCGMSRKNRDYVGGCPSLDIEGTRKSWAEYDIKALPAMLDWVQIARPQHGEFFRHSEVMGKLKEYDPPCCHESTFVKKTLLPELSKRGIQNFPLDLIAILYTLGVPGDECKILSVGLDIDPMTGLGSENLFLQFMYEDTGQVCPYRIRNFEHPEIAKVEAIR
jgi:hypothetical protein